MQEPYSDILRMTMMSIVAALFKRMACASFGLAD